MLTYAISMVTPSLSQVIWGWFPARSRPLAPQYSTMLDPSTATRSCGRRMNDGDTPWWLAARMTDE